MDKINKYINSHFNWNPIDWEFQDIPTQNLHFNANLMRNRKLVGLNLTSKSNDENAAGGKATLCKYVMRI